MDQLLSSQQMEDASSKFTARSAGSARIRNNLMQRADLLSLCSKYRYRLGRCRAGSPPLAFIRFNPRTINADVVEGATLRSCFGVVKTRSIDSIAELANLLAIGEHHRHRSPLLEMVERMERWPRTCAPPAKRWPARATSRLRATRIEHRRWSVHGGADRREELRNARRPHFRNGRPPALHETGHTVEAAGPPLESMGFTFEFGASHILRGAGLRACSRACLTCEHDVLLGDNTITCNHAQRPDMRAPVTRWMAGCDRHEPVKAQSGDAK